MSMLRLFANFEKISTGSSKGVIENDEEQTEGIEARTIFGVSLVVSLVFESQVASCSQSHLSPS